LGRNLRASALGVFSVWMKMDLLPSGTEMRGEDGWWRGWRVGREREFEAAMEGRRTDW
jgi:hypothetical protein